MKTIILIFLIACFITSCETVQKQSASDSNIQTESNSVKVETTPNPKPLLEDLTAQQKEQLDKSFPPKAREILDKAEEIEIYAHLDRETKEMKILSDYRENDVAGKPNTVAKISDPLKKQFLDNFYYDTALGEWAAACWSPRQRVKAKYKNKDVEFDICYECSHFKGGGSSGKLFGNLNRESKSSRVINEIIEKHGIAIQ